jgi:hypothetical protein
LLTIAASTAFANGKVRKDPGVEEVFNREFSGAENVSWSRQGEYQKAIFVLGGHRVIAYFNEDNELAGCIRDIFYDQLPLIVMKAVDNKFPRAGMQEIREITNDDGTSYLVRVELNKKKYKVRITSAGNITDIEKLAK